MEIPAPLASLAARLDDLGFACDATDASEIFGDRVVVCEGPTLAVRMVSDRGEWFLEVARVDWGDWFDADVWKACLEDSELPFHPRDLSAQAEYVALNVQRLAAAVEADEDVLGCLRQGRAERARRRLGLDDE